MVMTDIIRVDWSIWPTDHYHDHENSPHPSLTKHNSHIANRDEITSCNSRHVHYNTTSTCSTSVGEWPLLVGNEASALYHGVSGAGDAVHLDELCQGHCAWVGWLIIGVCVNLRWELVNAVRFSMRPCKERDNFLMCKIYGYIFMVEMGGRIHPSIKCFKIGVHNPYHEDLNRRMSSFFKLEDVKVTVFVD